MSLGHLLNVFNECANYILRTIFHDLIGFSSLNFQKTQIIAVFIFVVLEGRSKSSLFLSVI